MQSGPIKLIFDKIIDVKPGGELVPFYHFKMATENDGVVGHINFKIGETNHIIQCVGHIGYEVLPKHRGNSYAFYACNALRPFIKTFYSKVILTSDPSNQFSIGVIEKLGAKFINTIKVPEQDPSYKGGSRIKNRYEWAP